MLRFVGHTVPSFSIPELPNSIVSVCRLVQIRKSKVDEVARLIKVKIQEGPLG